MIIEDRK